ncbi:TIGR03435 family protein [Granulicella tundricola]|uniref:Soil-associated protein, TIGR03435 family n=1 Tax=Granulicella tundricola (strain ATCC BAA-1859 / DSM 23138 / MP5ACTX9) TaxID=1198114 RepID=E8X3Y9_GRATM|nr:TIGR03435 family protein [Granulicella tundricola]ADW70497.1 hypothetical protein AciX9_3492 [Granulicella tundricola MP5ACTX9]
MVRWIAVSGLVMGSLGLGAQGTVAGKAEPFEVATIKLVDPGERAGRFIRMEGDHRFIGKNYTLKLLIAAAYELNPKTISGGPGWVTEDHYDVVAVTPGEKKPSRDQQMAMLRLLISERFALKFHREQKEFSIYELSRAKGGSKLKASTQAPDEAPQTISTVYPQKIKMPARNVSMGDFASVLQRAILDRPVVDKTGLTGRYDFDLEWAPDETQLSGDIPAAPADSPSPPLFTAVQEQLGLKLEETKGMVNALVIDGAHRPLEN